MRSRLYWNHVLVIGFKSTQSGWQGAPSRKVKCNLIFLFWFEFDCRRTLSLLDVSLSVRPYVSPSGMLYIFELFSVVFIEDIDLKFDTRSCIDVMQVTFRFYRIWSTWTQVIVLKAGPQGPPYMEVFPSFSLNLSIFPSISQANP